MKVLFIAKELKMEHLGIMYLTAALRGAGHEVQLIRADKVDPVKAANETEYDVLCYSVCSGLEKYYVDLDDAIVAKLPAVRSLSLFGGPAVTFNTKWRDELNSNPRRFAIGGECENYIVSIVNQFAFDGSRPKPADCDMKLVDVNKIPIADRQILYQFPDLAQNPIKNVMTRRGCANHCGYCYNGKWNILFKSQLPKKVVRHRDVDSVIEECLQIKTDWGVKLFNFVDDNFASSTGWLEEFADKYPQRVGVPFFCSVRPENATEKTISAISKAGGRNVNMAIESANDDHRRNVLSRTGSKDSVRRAIKLVHKYGMYSRLQNIIGLPVPDSLADAYETLKFNCEVKPTTSWCAILQAYPGTGVYDYAKEHGYTPDDDSTDEGFFGISTLKIRKRRLVERLHKLWPVLTQYSWLRWLAPLLIRLPLPFSWYLWFHQKTKKWLSEKEFWAVCRRHS